MCIPGMCFPKLRAAVKPRLNAEARRAETKATDSRAAEQRLEEEAAALQAAEQRAEEEAAVRQAAEQRRDKEAAARRESEERLRQMKVELARLRRQSS